MRARAFAAAALLGLFIVDGAAASSARSVNDSTPSPSKAIHHAPRARPTTSIASPHAPENHFEITAHIVAAGASKPSSSACFHMNATIGEPVAGTSTSAHYILKGGFAPIRATTRDVIFSNPFEACTP